MPKRLYRSKKNRVFLGVCGGIAEYLNIDPTVVRLIWVILTAVTMVVAGIIIYFVAAMIMPEK